MQTRILKSTISDNYFYLVSDEAGRAALIDPIDAPTAIEAVNADGLELEFVVNTHFHHDHVGGNDEVLDAFPQANLVAGPDADRIDGRHPIRKVLRGGDELRVGAETFDILATPGHTPGHISLLHGSSLFSGDTIFVAGAGNCRFGGDAGVLFRTFRDVLGRLDDDVTFYPGHDYARRNLEFALALEPTHGPARKKLEEIDDEPGLVVTTLGEERRYNPFLRFDDGRLDDALAARHPETLAAQRAAAQDEREAIFRAVRALRNDW